MAGRHALLGVGLVVLLTSLLTACGGGSNGSPTITTTGSSHATKSPSGGDGASSQAKQVVVPKIVGEHYVDAVRELHHRGLSQHAPGFTGSDSSTALNGCETILSQAPSPGAKVPPRTTIAIVFGLAH